MKTLFFIFVFLILSTFLTATIINVPADQPTIQAGINVAVNSDTVLVQPGTYIENINYNEKNITVASLFLTTQDTTYIAQTIIDGNQDGSVVTFENGEDSTAVLTGFTITNGSADYGGGIYCKENSSPSLENVTIVDNSADNYGGGIYCYDNSSPSLVNMTISGNAANYGGGIYCSASNPCLNNVAITDNSSDYGGGICCAYSSPILENVTITDNFSVVCGGICCDTSSPSLKNVTITGNSASSNGGGIYCYWDSSPSLVNCILWNDSPQEIYFYPDYDPNSITISYSDIQGGETGIVTNNNGTVYWLEGNIDADPLFVDVGSGDYHLTENSPCIDAGNPDPIYYDPEDPSNPGYALYPAMGTIINDMGAYGGPNAIGWPVVSVDDNVIVQTSEVLLHQNFPNPFNPQTTILFSISKVSEVHLSIFNIKGQKVENLVNEVLSAGEHSIVWDGRDSNGNRVSSGIYLYQLQTGSQEQVSKMLLLK